MAFDTKLTMKLAKKEKDELMAVYEDFLRKHLYNKASEYFTSEADVVGSPKKENPSLSDQALQLTPNRDQNLEDTIELRDLKRTLKIIKKDVVLITDLASIFVLKDSQWTFHAPFQLNSLFEKNGNRWSFTYKNDDTPFISIQDSDLKQKEDVLKENQSLREKLKKKTIELQHKNRDLQIEASLERVRSRSMTMHKSEELSDVIQIVYEQLCSLDFKIEHAGFIIDFKTNEDMHIWLTDTNGVPSEMVIPYFESPHWNSFNDAKKHNLNFFSNSISLKQKNIVYKSLLKVVPSPPKEMMERYFSSGALDISTVLLDNVGIYIENFQGISYSNEQNQILMRFGKVFQQTYTRFQDLQKAESQIREARIETALERMRSVALNIRTTREVLLVAESMYNELKLLEFDNIRNAQIVIDLKENDTYLVCVHSDDTSEIIREARYETSPIIQRLYDELDASHDAFYQREFKGEEFKTWLDWRKSITDTIDDPILKATSISFYLFSIGEGHLGISSFNTISEEKITILKRFKKVFEITYKRFIELQKSEAQEREVQIELALERIRARTMAMRHSNELHDASQLLDHQIRALGIDTWGCAFNIYGEEESYEWFSSKAGIIPPYKTPRDNFFKEIYDKGQEGESMYILTWEGDACAKHYDYLCSLPEVGEGLRAIKASGGSLPTYQIDHAVFFKQGYLLFITFEDVPKAHDIFKRFAKVFEQTYTRFLDLQKAEAQTKEAQIEAALEKVRTVALSLTSSEGMLDIAKSLFTQLLKLGFEDMRNAIIDIHNDDQVSFLDYDYSHDMSSAITHFSFFGDPVIEQQIKQIESSNDAFFEIELKGEQINELIETRLRNGEKDDPRLHTTEHLTYNLYSFGNGAIGISNFGILTDDQKAILKRFRNVFTFAYKRYVELHNAELQARESLVEIGLERVRSRTLAMQTSGELADTAMVLFKQLIDLGIAPNRLFLGIIKDKSSSIQIWATNEQGNKIGSNIIFDSEKNSSIKKIFNAWKKKETSLTFMMEGNELLKYLKHLKELGISVSNAESQKKRYQSVAFFSNGMIGIAASEEQPQDTLKLLERFAGVFNLTYTRFKDLKVAEAQAIKSDEDLINLKLAKKRAEEALIELQHTQAQLIQSEKMASLGELTAGIAHEIQNPLNFVNNFSELNTELIDEMKEEMESGDMEEVRLIMADLKLNIEKIHHHGKRAEAIVKGMLQHSRTSSAEKEPTDINKLADEYFRLAYHGLRAKDHTFNATLQTDYDDTIGMIPLISQDIGRVILNLITNAFYAVDQKKKSFLTSSGELTKDYKNYIPIVKVSTALIASTTDGPVKILISVKDNGDGIPKEVIDKIFQPFFTTKPTGQGTGLGLSMSYDIITIGHEGTLTANTEQGKGTEFKITIPLDL